MKFSLVVTSNLALWFLLALNVSAKSSVDPENLQLSNSGRYRTAQDHGIHVSNTKTNTDAIIMSASISIPTTIDVRNYGAVGGATYGLLLAPATTGTTSLTLLMGSTVPILAGQLVFGPGVPAGTVVEAILLRSGTKTVTLSSPIAMALPINTRLDFATLDDLPAFHKAQVAAAATGSGIVTVPPGEYYLSSYVQNIGGVRWSLQGSNFVPGGGIADAIDQSASWVTTGPSIYENTSSPSNENGFNLALTTSSSNSLIGYQKNGWNVTAFLNDPSCYSFVGRGCGGVDAIVRDTVGYSAQMTCPSSNPYCSMFGMEFLLTFQEHSNGPQVGFEDSLVNDSGIDVPEAGSWNTHTGITLVSSGSNINTTALGVNSFGSAKWQNGIIFFQDTVVQDLLALTSISHSDNTQRSASHANKLYIANDGKFYGQALQIGAGNTIADVDAIGGFNVGRGGVTTIANSMGFPAVTLAPNPSSAIKIGDKRLPSGPTPCELFSVPGDAAIDGIDAQICVTGKGAFSFRNEKNNQIAYMGEGILQAQSIQAAATSGISLSFNGTRSGGDFYVQLTDSGYDVIREQGSQALFIQTMGGINAQFNDDGSTVFNGSVKELASPVSEKTSSSILSLADCGTSIRSVATMDSTLTVPLGLPLGCRTTIVQAGRGTVTFIAAPGETLESLHDGMRTAGQYASVDLLVDSTRSFLISGSIR